MLITIKGLNDIKCQQKHIKCAVCGVSMGQTGSCVLCTKVEHIARQVITI